MTKDINDLRREAKELNINSFGKSREVLQEEINAALSSQDIRRDDEVEGDEEYAETEDAPEDAADEAPAPIRRDLSETTLSARERAERIREERQARRFSIQSLDYNLALESPIEEGFTPRWVNDSHGRIQKFQAAGWEIVDGVEPRTVSKRTGLKAFLMQIPTEIYEEDYAARQKALDEVEEEILKGNNKDSESIESNRRAGQATITRGKKVIKASY